MVFCILGFTGETPAFISSRCFVARLIVENLVEGLDHRSQCHPEYFRRLPEIIRRRMVRQRYVLCFNFPVNPDVSGCTEHQYLGYLLTQAAFQLLYGRVYANFSVKYTFLAAIGIFELGSLVCGVAPTSTAFIVGRAVAGLGGAGISSGALIIITHTVPLRMRPIFVGSLGAVFAVASVLGPILGGIFSTKLTWRWCFYVNLPFGGAAILAVLLLFKPPKRPQVDSIPLKEKLSKIDILGTLLFIPSIICLLLALQWGGSTYAWNDGRIIALFVVFGVVGIAFLAFEYWKGAEATLPLRMLTRRSVAAATWNCFCNGATFLTFTYYIPFWHQIVRNVNAADSGVSLLPFVLGVVIMAMLSGGLVSKFGYCRLQA